MEEHFVGVRGELGQGQINPVPLNRNEAMDIVHVKHRAIPHAFKHPKSEEANYSTCTSQITEGELQVMLRRMVNEAVSQTRQC